MLVLHTKRNERSELEAAVLQRAAHRGVVELVDVVDGALRTRWVEGRPLAEVGPLPPNEVAGLMAAVATTLADLHDRGVVHGGLDATHVLVDSDGQPVLCSLGRPGQPADDVAALGRLTDSLLTGGLPEVLDRPPAAPRRGRHRGLGPMLAPPVLPALRELAARAMDDDPARRPSARQFASELQQRATGARLPRPRPAPLLSAPGRFRPVLPRWVARGGAALAASALAVLAAVLVATTDRGQGTPPHAVPTTRPTTTSTTRVPPTTAAVVAERVWPREPLDFRDGVLTVKGTRYAVGQPGDAAVAGDWSCTGQATVALLRPTTGEVFAFDGWAEEGQVLTARTVGRVEGAAGLHAADVDGDGCQDLLAIGPEGEPVRLEARP